MFAHGGKPTVTGQLLDTTTQQLRLELGTPGSLTFASPHLLRAISTPCWLVSLVGFAQQHSIEIHDTSPPLILLCANDQFLMHWFSQDGYSKSQLRLLNECRMWLQS